jgi:formylglycine-generating enzyme required for sulfatase activity
MRISHSIPIIRRIPEILFTILLFLIMAFTISAESVSIHGIVTDSVTNAAVPGAAVQLKHAGLSTTTNASGEYTLGGSTVIQRDIDVSYSSRPAIAVNDRRVEFQVTDEKALVTIALFDMHGRELKTIKRSLMPQGQYRVDLPDGSAWSQQVVIVSVKINESQTVATVVPGMIGSRAESKKYDSRSMASVAKSQAINDTLLVSKTGYLQRQIGITNMIGTVNVKLLPRTNAIPVGMKRIEGGGFMMGANTPEESPIHPVIVSSFYMDSVEVTQADYIALMGVEPWKDYDDDYPGSIGPNYPVWYVDWYDAVLYCNSRSKRDGYDTLYSYTAITGIAGKRCQLTNVAIDFDKNGYRLPTEAEWEYAARAGTQTKYYWGDATDLATAGQYAWWVDNSMKTNQPVAQKKPNDFGLYDMLGNAPEWCNDNYNIFYYMSSDTLDPKGPSFGSARISRGGGWTFRLSDITCAHRGSIPPHHAIAQNAGNGLRCCMSIK